MKSLAEIETTSQATSKRSGHNFLRHALTLFAFTVALSLFATTVSAQQATPTTQVGDTVTHPVTGVDATVVAVLPDYAVLTSNNDIIVVFVNPGDVFTPNGGTTQVTVVSVTMDPNTGLIDSIVIDPNDPNNPPNPPAANITIPVARNVDQAIADAIAAAAGAGGTAGGDLQVTIPTGNVNVFAARRVGSSGGDGNDGYGLQICDPLGIFGCTIIGYGGTNGGSGSAPSDMIYTVDASNGDIQSISDGVDGIQVVSIGGNGGEGGDAFGNFDALRGGNAGAGGTVTVTSNVNISTAGERAHGMYGQSRAGVSGDGGNGYIFSGGGDGGTAGLGGTVTLTNNGAISTLGNGSHGMYALSQGGSAGNGANSWGLVGAGGSSPLGGDGGTAIANNNGSIVTEGFSSHGMLAQSIGGTGGNGGDAGGFVAFGGSGSAGGDGGAARANNGSSAQIVTRGDQSIGVLAQSIGGGGGDGGFGGGVVAFGGTGSAGGAGGTVIVTNADGSSITTEGQSAHGILAQSVGGGGGNGATAGGFVALGGNGSAAGNGDTVTVTNGANITTSGVDARGLFAQSIGGGGGSANGTGGVVSLGGRGGSGGTGGSIIVNNNGTIVTQASGSDAIYAQSVGGGGGSGAASGGAVSIGGSGNSGGAAASVGVTNDGTIATDGNSARGIFAQSIGGGGGSGGHSGGLISIGGSGSVASSGSTVTVINNGSIATAGTSASAIQAQSIGGGGGDGGTTGGVLLTIGGGGGGGGSANTVTVESNRNLITSGNDSHGIFAQAVGGGGGNGGNSASGSLFAGVSIGGDGGNGGDGATVNVDTNEYDTDLGAGPVTLMPLIQTSGDRSNGILAHSIGGGGGNGGFAVQGTLGTFVSASIAIGGSAGDGGDGGDVNVNSTAAIITAGENADGIVAESIGGGGGNGGFSVAGAIQANPAGGGSIAVGVGGSGGGGGDGGSVDANFIGSILTSGEMSEGFIAQSLGGGGGNGGFNVSGSISGGGVGSAAIAVGVGGSGGTGGDGGIVTASTDATILTQGDQSTGVLFQSVGGGGGNGGFNISAALSGGGIGSGAINVGVGGSGSGGGAGGDVTGTVNGMIATSGDQSTGINMESIGGGGGNGGFNIGLAVSAAGGGTGAANVGLGGSSDLGGAGGSVIANIDADVFTDGDSSTGVLLQSIGGGGGNGGFNITGAGSGGGPGAAVNVAIGGSAGPGGNGGTVTADNMRGNIQTMGNSSNGIEAQSIGGGGGDAQLNIGVAVGLSGVGVSVGIGGAAGDAGDGDAVRIGHTGDITTNGYDSAGIFAQSIGGGGGNTSLNIATGFSSLGKIDVGLGREGGIGGAAGTVEVSSDGTITTFGENSIGVLAQSVGNGGGKSGSHSFGAGGGSGAMGVSLGLSLGLQGGDGGTADDVTVTTRGRVQTVGNDSHAIYAQSVGGGGGIGGMSILPVISSSTIGASIGGMGGIGGTSGVVTVDNFAELLTLGDDANGIFAQSIGGGGGNGGIAATGGIQIGPANATFTMGGNGGTGALGGDVNVTNSNLIETFGLHSNGIYAQSLGGGGGNGGLTLNRTVTIGSTPAVAVTVVVGGEGGTGGEGGDTQVTNTGIVATAGDEANGIFAQSVGGGGGNGGLTMNLIGAGTPGGGQIGITIGGDGGTGGTGGDVTVDNLRPTDGSDGGIVFTSGRESHGIYAQSIGGGGGNGSSTLSLLQANGSGNLQVGFALGGNGGTGGTAGDVTVNNDGFVETQGDGSHGVYAQSIGGGGGNGGLAIAANVVLSFDQASSFTPLFVMGGSGGDGDNGGTVIVNNLGNILTSGIESHGIVAESIGGGGGDGALSIGLNTSLNPAVQALTLAGPLFSALGGTGGEGGLGGDVTVIHSGDITTLGDGSEAIVARSINGGGGQMRLDFSGITNIYDQILGGIDPDFEGTRYEDTENGDGDALLRFDLGAFDTEDAVSGTVLVNTTGTINTLGRDSIGQSIQAIGGGGGILKWRAELVENVPGARPLPVLLQLGGTNGLRNSGGDIDTTHLGDSLSMGVGAHGAFIQSVGGGGGRAVVNLDIGRGRDADMTFLLGGRAGNDEAGGFVDYTRIGSLVTLGNNAMGTALQSIGGGGGILSLRIDGEGSKKALTPASVTLGAESGLLLDGGDMDITLSGDLLTQGQQSHGLFAQSIGAGGGLVQIDGANTVDVTIGSSGGASGNGGSLTIINTGNIWTEGDMANGVFLQSIGGGGGALFSNSLVNPLTITLNNAGIGDGGVIDFTQNGNVVTSGAGAYGIFAQSIGGGGGIVNDQFAGSAGGSGSGGNIDLQINGSVMAIADGATAVFAQSDGADGAGNISISLLGDNAVVAGLGGTAIFLSGGNDNVITNNGLIGTYDDGDGIAIATDANAVSGNESIFNFGTVFGSVLLGSGENYFRNEIDAMFLSGANVQLDTERTGGAEIGTLFNFGMLLPGGMNRTMETTIEGRFVQADGATLMSDLDLSRTSSGPQADQLTISGTALLGGTIDINMYNAGFVLPGQYQDILLSASGGLGTFEGMLSPFEAIGTLGVMPDLTLNGTPTSAVASFRLEYLNSTDVVLSSNINFAPGGLNANQLALGEHVNDIQLAGGTEDFAPVAAGLFFTETFGELQETYNMLSPEPYADALSTALLSSTQFGETLTGCRNRRGDASMLDEGQCRWFKLSHRHLERDATSSSISFEQEGIEISAGAQFEIGTAQHLGFGVAFMRGESRSGSFATGDSDIYQIGAVHRQRGDKFALTSSLAAGYGAFDTARFVNLPALVGVAESSPSIFFASAHSRLSYDLGGERWYFRSNFDAGVNYVRLNSFTEQGAGAVSLELPSMRDVFLSVHPSIEFGREFALGGPVRLRPYGRLGVLHVAGSDSPELSATFSGAPDDLTPFTTESGMDRSYGDFAIGFDLLGSKDNLLRIEGNGLFGSDTDALGFEASWSFAF